MTIVNMEKSVVFLVIVGGLLATGIILSFYGAQLTTQDLISNEGIVSLGESFEIQAELDPTKSKTGVFVIQILDFKDNEITAKISDPLDYEILSKSFDKGSIEERFEIASEGTYKLIIENSSSSMVNSRTIILKDIESIDKRIKGVEKLAKSGDKDAKSEFELLMKISDYLNKGNLIIDLELSDIERKNLKSFSLLTAKPMVFIANISDDDLVNQTNQYGHQ